MKFFPCLECCPFYSFFVQLPIRGEGLGIDQVGWPRNLRQMPI